MKDGLITVCVKRNAHLIPNFLWPPGGRGTENSHGRLCKQDMTLGQGQRSRGPWKNGKIEVAFLFGKSALQNEFMNNAFFKVEVLRNPEAIFRLTGVIPLPL